MFVGVRERSDDGATPPPPPPPLMVSEAAPSRRAPHAIAISAFGDEVLWLESSRPSSSLEQKRTNASKHGRMNAWMSARRAQAALILSQSTRTVTAIPSNETPARPYKLLFTPTMC